MSDFEKKKSTPSEEERKWIGIDIANSAHRRAMHRQEEIERERREQPQPFFDDEPEEQEKKPAERKGTGRGKSLRTEDDSFFADLKKKRQLEEKQKRMKRAREKDELYRRKLKAEAERDRRRRAEQRERERIRAEKQEAQKRKKYSGELSSEENRRRRLNREKKKEKRLALIKWHMYMFSASLVVGVILFVLSFASFLIIFNMRSAPSDDVTVNICGIEKDYTADELINGKSMYICMDDVSAGCGFMSFKENDSVRFISSDSGNEAVVFTPGSATAVINGTKTRMDSNALLYEEKLYVPLSFFTDYCLGLDIEADRHEGIVNISRKETGTVGNKVIYEDITFTVKNADELEHIDENIIPD